MESTFLGICRTQEISSSGLYQVILKLACELSGSGQKPSDDSLAKTVKKPAKQNKFKEAYSLTP
jgi:hypothetical protein